MKNEYVQKASLRLKQTIKVLVSKPSFLNAVLVLRKKWGIPNEGLTSQADLDKWYQKINKDTEEYLDRFWPSKRQELVEIRSKGNLSEHKKAQDEFNNKVPRNAFLIDIRKLTHKQKLSPRWVEGIKRFLLFNNPNNMGIFVGPIVSTKFDLEFETETISLEIEPNTTLEDVKAIWPTVKEMQARLPYSKQKKFQPILNFERDKRIYELNEEGASTDNIGDIVQEEFGDSLDYNQINIAIKRYKKRLNIN